MGIFRNSDDKRKLEESLKNIENGDSGSLMNMGRSLGNIAKADRNMRKLTGKGVSDLTKMSVEELRKFNRQLEEKVRNGLNGK